MKYLAIIPARAGSKGIPNKNSKLLNGIPLIAYTLKAALGSKVDKVVVSTDSKEVEIISQEYGVEVVKRPSELATDTSPTIDAIKYTVSQVSEGYDAVVVLQPTSPLRTSQHIDEALKIFDENEADSLVSVVEVPHNMAPEKLMKLQDGELVGGEKLIRRQELPQYYARNGAAIYITKINRVSEYILGGKILPYIMNKKESFDIDDIQDWEIVEKLLS